MHATREVDQVIHMKGAERPQGGYRLQKHPRMHANMMHLADLTHIHGKCMLHLISFMRTLCLRRHTVYAVPVQICSVAGQGLRSPASTRLHASTSEHISYVRSCGQ